MVNFPSIVNDLLHSDWNWDHHRTSNYRPAVNISENDDAYIVEMIAPGFERENFSVEVKDGKLSISAEIEQQTKDENEKYTHVEFTKSAFTRSFVLPKESADEDKVDAIYKNGVLAITIAKKEEAKPKAPRMVDIK